ncbi:hypothetical protein PINS_up007886 [Pythium insidiosum]|nr:hypothetical protein PINS_up007886 [Pythium insidiosum]
MAPRSLVVVALVALAVSLAAARAVAFPPHQSHRRLQSLHAAPSLRLRFSVKRASMKIHGHDTFDVLVARSASASAAAEPTAGLDRFEFNGIAAFPSAADSVTHTYSLVDGVAYHERRDPSSGNATHVSFVAPHRLPPIHEALAAIAGAVPVPAASVGDRAVECPPSMELLHATFASEHFALCAATALVPEDDLLFRVVGSDLDVDIFAERDRLDIQPPSTKGARAIHRPTHWGIVPRSSPLLTSTESSRRLSGGRPLVLSKASCSCASKRKRPCLFFHGMDIKEDRGVVDEFDFFGDIKSHASCCSSVRFAIYNTVDFAWNNATLQERACNDALAQSPTSDRQTRTIKDTILIAHSMGNLMLAHAVASKRCSLDASSSWVDLSGPMRGSMGSDFQQFVCSGGSVAKDALAVLVELFGQCPSSKARQALVYQGGKYASEGLNRQYDEAQAVHAAHVSASICGDSYNGLLSKEWLGLYLGGTVLPHKSKANDGVVEFQSCAGKLPSSTFGRTWESAFYRAKLNHADTQFKNGDALFDDAQKPVKWFECLTAL